MIRVEILGEGKMVYWDSNASGLKAYIQLEEDGWNIEIRCETVATPSTITDVFIPVLEEAAKIANALNG